MPSYINKDGTNTTISSSTNVYARTDTTWSRVNNISVRKDASWVQVYQYDSTAPTVADWSVVGGETDNTMAFVWSGGPLVTDSESGVTQVQVQYQYTPWGGSGEGWNSWLTWTASEWTATSGSPSFTVSTAKRATQGAGSPGFYVIQNRYYVDFRVIATDAVGNTTTKTMANGQLTRPYGTFYIVPQGSGSVAADSFQQSTVPNGFYGLSSSGVRAGDATSVGGLNWTYGCWFYGDEVETYHLQRNASGNRYKADSGTLFAVRPAGVGNGGTFAFRQHNLRFSNGTVGATFSGNTLLSSSMNPPGGGGDSTATMTLDAGHLSDFSTLTAKGFGQVRNSGSTLYRVCRNYLENLTASGRITLVFN